MEYRRKFILVAALIAVVLPLRSFAEVAANGSNDTKTSDALKDETDRKPLFLSLSLSMSSPSLRRADIRTGPAVQNDASLRDEAEGEPLFLPLSLSLSLPPVLVVKNSEDNVTASEKFDSESGPTSRESLFGDDEPLKETPPEPAWKKLVSGWTGFSQLEIADNYTSPEHFSKAKLRTELSRRGQFNENIKWKISGRFDYDAAYDLSSFYPSAVRQDQRYDFFLRENYLDISAGDFDFRLGRQHVIWGEMVGLFFADVVSAKDQREFVLPSFDIIRIPQWAMRAEYSKNDVHAEVLWIPIPTLDEIGQPGSDFYPSPLQGTANFLKEDRSGRNVGNSNYGLRLSHLKNGWDVSAFYYHSLDASSTFYRVSGPTEPLVFQARHDEIDQVGATLAKDFGSIVLKGELVYTDGRKFNVARPTAIDGLVRQNTLDYVLGLDFSLPAEARLNLQFFQRVFFSHDPGIFTDRLENGASILLFGKLSQKLEAQGLLIHSLNRSDWMFRPRLSWNFEKNWRWALGADVFGGQPTGLFGRFDQSDRVYTELRYSF
ncbi:DUF1302 family protein [Nitrosovibrio sp. Nv6]|uniref:DUF1302 family protein n=1 Tax=Nitrosovibrio sp. Nv6 TaxID=1855340 RepID=UPI0008C072A3|nr:DUF1302 family protein [Nitrosovibrio sp. Nv6]SEP07711.1 hypothetical protein SAMN05216316_1657 [Nitrosovibrio sp. Nv6]